MFNWQGRTDSEDGELGLRWHQKVNQPPRNRQSATLVGMACDLGVHANKGRVGAAAGPNAIRAAMANLPWHWQHSLVDAGDTVAVDNLPKTQSDYAICVSDALNNSRVVLGLGGGHEIAWGSYIGLVQYLKDTSKSRIGIVNFDAHFDLRKPAPNPSSGTPFRQIAEHRKHCGLPFDYACLGVAKSANTPALFEFAHQSGARYLLDRHCDIARATELLVPMLKHIDQLYVTICLDAFPAAVAPGVSAPSPLGIPPAFVIDMLHWLAQQQSQFNYQWQLTDIAEMNPEYDIDGRTAKLAARLGFEVVDALLS